MLTATDGVNFLTVSTLIAEEEVFGPIVVQADSFIKLPGKTTKQSMKLTVLPDSLEVIGNGKYRVPIINPEDFPKVSFESARTLVNDVSSDVMKKMFSPNKTAVATDMTYPMLTGYLVNKGVVTTDKIRMVLNVEPAFVSEEKVLLSQRFVELLNGFTTNITLDVSKEGNLRATSADKTLIGPQLAGLPSYPNLDSFMDLDPKGKYSLDRTELLSVLDRVMLFVDTATNYGVRLSYTEGFELTVSDLRGNSEEKIAFAGGGETPFQIDLNTKYFVELLSSLSSKEITVQYEEGKPIKIVEGTVTILLSTIDPVTD
jgi:DNA polymerase III sliding clamp (beta) subunit (PCNA family)